MTAKASRAQVRGIEQRAWPIQMEVRNRTDTHTTIEGYASVVEQPYEMWDMAGPYTETVRSGAFTKTLSENPQVQLLLNHGGLAMAYTRSGSLRLSQDSTGLHVAADVNTTRSDVRDMVTAIEDRNIDEMSFAFKVTRQEWTSEYDARDIMEVSLARGDVSVVNFGANPATSVNAMRAADFDRLDETAARELYERLGARLADTKPQRPLSLYLAELDMAALAAVPLG